MKRFDHVSIVLMFLTKRTGSILPAAIAHSMNNIGGSLTASFFTSGVPEDFDPGVAGQIIARIPIYLICLTFLFMMLKDRKTGDSLENLT